MLLKNLIFLSLILLCSCSYFSPKIEEYEFYDPYKKNSITLEDKYSLKLGSETIVKNYSLPLYDSSNFLSTKEYYSNKKLKKIKFFNKDGELISCQTYYNNKKNTLKSKEIIKDNIAYIEFYSESGSIVNQKKYNLFNTKEFLKYTTF